MSNFKIEVSLVSELTSYAPSPDENFSDPLEFFKYLFYNDGGTGIRAYPTSPCVNPDVNFDPNESIFSDLAWDLDSEPIIAEFTNESYEDLSFEGSQSDGWDFTYALVNTFEVEVEAKNLTAAEQVIRDSVKKNLAIFDSGVEEILEIVAVRLLQRG